MYPVNHPLYLSTEKSVNRSLKLGHFRPSLALYVSLSTIALVMAASPKISSHLSNVRFEVIMVDFRDTRRERTVNNKSAAFRSKDM